MSCRNFASFVQIIVLLSACVNTVDASDEAARLQIQDDGRQLLIQCDHKPLATYVYIDQQIPRPWFAHVRTLDGIQVTRSHPPVEGTDPQDHPTMHPGIWLAFGDLGGTDFWRNKGNVRHVSFPGPPVVDEARGSFVELKEYVREDGSIVCTERFQCSIVVLPQGWLLGWDSTFQSPQEFVFGDQEEMGLGLRVATPLSETHGGQLRDATGRVGAAAIWSHAADWCDYSGTIAGRHAGMTLFCHPDNFRPSWFHARDYGFVAANPFGRQAMQKGDASSVRVAPGDSLRLRYAIWIHSSSPNTAPDPAPIYQQYLSGQFPSSTPDSATPAIK